MVQKLSYAGITLPLQTPILEKWMDAVHPREVFEEWEGWNFDAPDYITDSLPTPSIPRMNYRKAGVLYWPTGACRPAWFHAVVNRDKLDEIREVIGLNPMVPRDLVMFDDREGKTITASMYMLPARPLNQLGHTDSDAWWLTLTDQRFFWHWRRGVIEDGYNNSDDPPTWYDLFDKISEILGISITVDGVAPAYGDPSNKWLNYYGPTPVILDAAARQIGQRVVVALDGTVSTTTWTTAKAACEAYVEAADPEMSGGLMDEDDIGRYVPFSVNVLFLGSGSAPQVINKPLGLLGISVYDAIPASGMTGFSQVFYSDVPYDYANSASSQDYAAQAATDWYGWMLPNVDIVWPGIEPYEPTGWEDVIEWTFQVREDADGRDVPYASTQVRRGDFNDFVSGDWFAGENNPAEDDAPCWGNLLYKDECQDGFLVRLRAEDCESGSGSGTSSGSTEPNWQFDESLGVPCETPGSGSGSGDNIPDFPVQFEMMTGWCPPDCGNGIGDVIIKPTTTTPGCWLKADGSSVSRTLYGDLFGVYGTTFGSGDGSSTFGLPTLADPVTGLSYFVRTLADTPILEKRIVTVEAFGKVEEPTCDEPTTCCDDGSGSGGAVAECCPNGTPLDNGTFMAVGPLGINCAFCTITGELVRTGPAYWIPLTTTQDCNGRYVFDWSLFCQGGEWYAEGRIAGAVPAGGIQTVTFFSVELLLIDGNLIGFINVPGCDLQLTLTIPVPCSESEPIPNCTTVPPETIPTNLVAFAGGLPECFAGTCEYTLSKVVGPPVSWVSAGGCAGAGVTLSCIGNEFVLEISATEAGCLGGVPVQFPATGGGTNPFYLEFTVPLCTLCGGTTQDTYILTISPA